jgi:hypothetical protein
MAVPNIFGTATAAIPLSQLDQNFATAITLGNTAVYLGNTTTSLGNVTLTNVTISSGTSNIAANVSTAVGLLPEASGGTGTTVGYNGFKNRIINGAMPVSQYYGSTDTAVTGSTQYMIDRWRSIEITDGAMSVQQSTTSTAGFNNSMKFTVTTADASLAAGQLCGFNQFVEGFNVADFGWGTASAATVTLSFWVRSSLTGTFAGAFRNAALNRTYIFTYTINSADTFEYKTITVAGDTSGTWDKTNGAGIDVIFSLGTGTTYQGTAGSWQASDAFNTSGAVSVIGTLNATFYITGVQLEKGSTATSFDYRPYGTELLLCQRYYYAQINAAGGTMQFGTAGQATGTNGANGFTIPFPATMRVAPTALTTSTVSGFSLQPPTGGAYTVTAISALYGSQYQGALTITVTGGAFTAGQATWMYASATNAFVGFTAEL